MKSELRSNTNNNLNMDANYYSQSDCGVEAMPSPKGKPVAGVVT